MKVRTPQRARRSTETAAHPFTRFVADGGMEKGSTLKSILCPACVELIGESIASVCHDFDEKDFAKKACRGLEGLEFKSRAGHIARVMAEALPGEFPEQAEVLVRSLGPALTKTEGNGLAPFCYFPHSCFIGEYGEEHFEAGMEANYELTKRFTAEFSVRPYIAVDPERAIARLMEWTADENAHVRRLVSEGSRPRLPWGIRLKAVVEDPGLTLPLLEVLKDDPVLYVRRSVANHLGDVLKDHPDVAYGVCERWVEEAKGLPEEQRAARGWIVSHAVRLPAKRGVERAVRIRERVKG